MKLTGKNILVTGGTGFIGSHLVEALVNAGNHVVTTFQTQDPYSYFYSQNLHEKTVMTHVDIENFDAVHHVITKFDITHIFHLAAQPLVEVAYYNPRRTLSSNIIGTVNLLESARLYPKIEAVIVASSDKAYGKTKKKKYLETDRLAGDHPYEVSKSAADLIVNTYYATYGLPVVTARFGNIYGEGDLNFSRIIPGIMKSFVDGSVLQLRSDGKQVRDYVYVKDVVAGYMLMAENIKKLKGEAFNFGSSDDMTVLELIKKAEAVMSKKIDYEILNIAKNEIPYQVLDYTKAKKTFGWTPQNSVADTLLPISRWYYRHHLKTMG